jgi:hypothetical protein
MMPLTTRIRGSPETAASRWTLQPGSSASDRLPAPHPWALSQ